MASFPVRNVVLRDYPQQLPLEVVPQQELAAASCLAGAVPQQELDAALVAESAGAEPQQEESLAAVVEPQHEELAVGRPTAFFTRFTNTPPLFFSVMIETSQIRVD